MVSAVKIAIGVFGLILMGLVFIHGADAPQAVERRIAQAAETVRAEAGADWAEIAVDGRHVRVSGAAPSEEAAEAFLQTLRERGQRDNMLFGPGAVLSAEDVRVADALPRAAIDAPGPELPQPERLVWRAAYKDGAVTLTGAAPSETARSLLAATAAERFPGAELRDASTLAESAQDGAWLAAAGAGLTALAALENGELAAVGERFTLEGLAPDEYSAERATTLLCTLPEPFTGSAKIRVRPKPPQPAAPSPAPAAKPSAQERARQCQSRIDAKMAGGQIEFASGETSIEAASLELLEAIAADVVGCADFSLIISGHTDSSGDARDNLELSAERAQAVKSFLMAQGVDENQLIPVGYGETRPIVSNETPDGRARNRRIEFTVALTERDP